MKRENSGSSRRKRDETKWVSWLALAGMLMPVGILTEVLLGAPPLFVLIGGISMVAAIAWLGVAVAQMESWPEHDESAKI